jgi:hypothetical protein
VDDKIQETLHESVHEFMKGLSLGIQNMPKEFEEDKKYLFVFLDHLGFSNKVLRATENDGWLSFCADMGIIIDESLQNILSKCQQWNSPISKVRRKRFSDSICLFWEIGDYEDENNYYTTEEFAGLVCLRW